MHASYFLPNFLEILKHNSVSLLNILIAMSTIGVEQIFSKVIFLCPCGNLDNRIYGLVYLVVPAVVLLILGYALNSSTWRLFTGICKRSTNSFGKMGCYITFQILMRSLVAPVSWICIALLDGKYYACAMTSQPYDQSCIEVYTGRTIKYSIEYHNSVAQSQVIGWLATGISFVVGTILFSTFRCCSPLTHWQRQYLLLTKSIERTVFEEKAKEMSRSKNDWDQITEMYFVKEMRPGTKIKYSALQNWVSESLKNEGEEVANNTSL
ncbi:calcium homeostasis modulator protein 6-like isoform X2 [Styela clava]